MRPHATEDDRPGHRLPVPPAAAGHGLLAVIAGLGLPGLAFRGDAVARVLPAGVRPVLVPDLAGPMGFPRSDSLFPEAAARAGRLRASLGAAPVVLVLFLPSYPGLLRAAFDAQPDPWPGGFGAFVRAFARVPAGLPDLAQALAAGLGPLRIIVLPAPVRPAPCAAAAGAAPGPLDPLALADLAGRAIADRAALSAIAGLVIPARRPAGRPVPHAA